MAIKKQVAEELVLLALEEHEPQPPKLTISYEHSGLCSPMYLPGSNIVITETITTSLFVAKVASTTSPPLENEHVPLQKPGVAKAPLHHQKPLLLSEGAVLPYCELLQQGPEEQLALDLSRGQLLALSAPPLPEEPLLEEASLTAMMALEEQIAQPAPEKALPDIHSHILHLLGTVEHAKQGGLRTPGKPLRLSGTLTDPCSHMYLPGGNIVITETLTTTLLPVEAVRTDNDDIAITETPTTTLLLGAVAHMTSPTLEEEHQPQQQPEDAVVPLHHQELLLQSEGAARL